MEQASEPESTLDFDVGKNTGVVCGNRRGRVIRLMKKYSGQFPFEKMISHRLSLDELVRNMHIVVNHDECVKVVVTPLKKD
ncbi:MAG: hypothetical protein FGF53_04390 [Candidatus Brockarchaeota archaeon]|nr:hypothetical protein [Candidatus Brockarchaeota archaeon]